MFVCLLCLCLVQLRAPWTRQLRISPNLVTSSCYILLERECVNLKNSFCANDTIIFKWQNLDFLPSQNQGVGTLSEEISSVTKKLLKPPYLERIMAAMPFPINPPRATRHWITPSSQKVIWPNRICSSLL